MNERGHDGISLVNDPGYPRLKRAVLEATGLAYYARNDAELSLRIARRMTALGLRDCADYLDVLQASSARFPSERNELLDELTIGETHFFRHFEQFDALRRSVVPDLIERNRAHRHLRIWSAGCATGAEAYTLSILLKRELAGQLDGWNVRIVATDVNRRFLEAASAARFTEWSLRSTPEEIRGLCFLRENKHFVLKPEYREGVSFHQHDLVNEPLPSGLQGLGQFDLILCRNVLIYFDAATSGKVVAGLFRALVPGGRLLVGCAEHLPQLFTQFEPTYDDCVLAYRKPASSVTIEDCVQPSGATPRVEAPAPSRPEPPPKGLSSALDREQLASIRACAERGDWPEVERACQTLLERDGLDPRAHFYRSLARERMGDLDAAVLGLRRAIYLDRNFVLAHFHLGDLHARTGRKEKASKCFENVLALLARRSDDDVVDEANGLKASELRAHAARKREVLSR